MLKTRLAREATVAGFAMAHEKYGTGPWGRLVDPAIELAGDGAHSSGAIPAVGEVGVDEAVELTDPTLPGYIVDIMSDPTLGSQIVDVAEDGVACGPIGEHADRCARGPRVGSGRRSKSERKKLKMKNQKTMIKLFLNDELTFLCPYLLA